MDIAEIRKKAKARKKTDAPAAEPETLHEPEQRHMPLSIEAQNVVVTPTISKIADVAAGGHAVSLQKANDVIDQLFAVTDDFVLATDESNADILEKQAGLKAQVCHQYLAFYLGDEEYALDITRISEIIKVREFTDLPRTPRFILGIISLRGVVVPVFDLCQRLNLGASEMSPSSRIVVCQIDDLIAGLLVDSINQVVSLADDEIEPPPGVLSGLDRDMVSGIGRCQGRMIILLNLHSALNVELN